MANVLSQRFYDFSNNFILGAHLVKLTAASDSFTVPRLADSTSGLSCKQLERSGDATVTVANSDAFTVTLTGSVDDEIVVATIHAGNQNQMDEA